MTSTFLNPTFSSLYMHQLEKQDTKIYQWEVDYLSPFDELILSWNAFRCLKGFYDIEVSLKLKEWSDWMLYAQWGKNIQKSFSDDCFTHSAISIHQDIIEIKKGQKATGFRIRIKAKEEANLEHFRTLYVCFTNYDYLPLTFFQKIEESIDLPISGISQLALVHPRNHHLCSPTSTAAVLRYLTQCNHPTVEVFAEQVKDLSFDIFGHWVFNVAQAFHELGYRWQCWIARVNHFNTIIQSLKEGMPVIVSVKGNLPRAKQTYQTGHLMVIKGLNSKNQQVLCMDPAYSTDEETLVSYPIADFIYAWSQRQFIAYFFKPSK